MERLPVTTMRLLICCLLFMTGVLYSMSEPPESFDLFIWSDFTDSQIISLLSVRINDLKQGLKILGTQLITQFAFCYTDCHSVEWLDGIWLDGPAVESMKPPCGAISIGIAEGDYMHQPIRISWNIQYVHSAVINLTIQEMDVPMLSVDCDCSHVTIKGSSIRKRVCGKQWNQTYYSKTNFEFQIFANVLTDNLTLCLSFVHSWHYEAPIADEDIHVFRGELHKESHVGYIIVQQQPNTNRKFLFAADFLQYNTFIHVNISTGESTVHAFDGPGRMSPLMTLVNQYSTFLTDVQFYLHLDIITALSDNETSISFQTVYTDIKQYHDYDPVKQDIVQQCENERHWFAMRHGDSSLTMWLESKSEENTWCQVFMHGKGVLVHIDEFMFDGPTVQHIHNDFLTCQFGGLFLKMYKTNKYASQVEYNFYNGLSICDEILQNDQFMLGHGAFSIFVVYFAGYSQGAMKFTVEINQYVESGVAQTCDTNLPFCIFQHNIWTAFETYLVENFIYHDDVNVYEMMNAPYTIYIPQYSTAHMARILDVTAGSVSNPYSLGTVQITITLTSETKPLDTVCPVRIQINMPPNKDVTSSDVNSMFSRKRTVLIPYAIYINIIVQFCPYLQSKDRLSVQVKVEKYQLCGVVDESKWPTQVARNCSHLTLPIHLKNASFYTEIMHAYELRINDACLDKSCLDITVAGYYHGSNSLQCDVIWKHVDVQSSKMKTALPGKIIVTWNVNASCFLSLTELRKCNLEIDITFNNPPINPGRSRYKHQYRTPEQISLFSNSRKDVILLRR